MSKETYLMLADHIARQFLENPSLDLNELVAQTAREYSMNSEQRNTLINEVNRAVFQKLFETHPDKTVEFPIAKPEIVDKLLKGKPVATEKTASFIQEEEINEEDYLLDDLYNPFFETLEKEASAPNLTYEIDVSKTKHIQFQKIANELMQKSEEVQASLMKLATAEQQLREVLAELKSVGLKENELVAILRQNVVPQEAIEYVRRIYSQVQPKPVELKKKASLKDAYEITQLVKKASEQGNATALNSVKKRIAQYDLNSLEQAMLKLGSMNEISGTQWYRLKSEVAKLTGQYSPESTAELLSKVAELADEYIKAEKTFGQFFKIASALKKFVKQNPDFEEYANVYFTKTAKIFKRSMREILARKGCLK